MSALLLKKIRTELQKAADPKRAPQMQAYMKSSMPFHGVASPVAKKIWKQILADAQFTSQKQWHQSVLELWHGAQFREERYGALALCGHKSARDYQNPAALPLYEELIVSGAWWDHVDDIAIHRVGPILGDYPEVMRKKMLAWSQDKDIWKRRSAIISQIMLKEKTDLDLLDACIQASIDSDEFFLRKGIGWALRQWAWREPKAVIAYVAKHKDRLSPLSKREALKNLLKSGKVKKVP